MPSQSRATQTQTATGTASAGATPATGGAQERYGNSFLQEQLKGRQSPGKLTWQSALGDTLGAKLYDALSAQLSDDRLLAHANRAVDSALNALKAELAGQVQPSEQEAADLFFAKIDAALRSVANDAVVGSGLAENTRELVDAHPYEVALAAVAGAVAYVLSNQDLPVIETKLGIGQGQKLVLGIDPGRTMDLALERVRVGYRYDGDRLAARLTADRFQDGYSVEGEASYKPGADSTLSMRGSHTDRAGQERSTLDLGYTEPGLGGTFGIQRNVLGDRTTSGVTAGLTSQDGPDALRRSVSGTWRDDGSWEAAAGIGRTEKDRSWSIEAYGGEDALGRDNVGVRALFKLRF